jgi:hypothetical protein
VVVGTYWEIEVRHFISLLIQFLMPDHCKMLDDESVICDLHGF